MNLSPSSKNDDSKSDRNCIHDEVLEVNVIARKSFFQKIFSKESRKKTWAALQDFFIKLECSSLSSAKFYLIKILYWELRL